MRRSELTSCLRFVVLLIGVALLLHLTGIHCPIKWMTGVSCPGCGLTRAWLQMLTLHPSEAIAYHPLFWLVPLLFVVVWLDHLRRRLWHRIVLAGIAAAFIGLWCVRIATPSDATLLVQSALAGDVVSVGMPAWLVILRSALGI